MRERKNTPKQAVEISDEAKQYIEQRVYDQYVSDTLTRFHWLSLLIAIGETMLVFLDYQSGFFQEHVLNHLNLMAEIILIVSGIIMFIRTNWLSKKKDADTKAKVIAIVAYRVTLLSAALMFMFTDIYVRKQVLGSYMVFLFVLQLTPAYQSRINLIQLGGAGIFAMVNYYVFASKTSNILFGTLAIFIAFAISTDALRRYFKRQLQNFYLAEFNNNRYRKLSGQAIQALAGAVEAKDIYTKGHSQRVAEYSREIAKRLGYEEKSLREVYFIGLMHDVGKIGIPSAVINKTSRLTDEEFAEIKKHPVIGYEILKEITELPGISEGARWHHERYDGKGYPDNLSGEDIPEIARIIAVADAYDAMTSNRSYRDALSQEEVRKRIAESSGTQFDPHMAEVMLTMIDGDTDYHMHE